MWNPELPPAGSVPLFRVLCDTIARDVREGRLQPGARLPTHRELSRQLGLARGTVARAYSEAERLGLLESEVGRGTFVRESELATDFEQMAYSTRDHGLLDLSLNFPLYHLDPDLSAVLREVADSPRAYELTRYQDRAGMPAHRAAGADWLARCGIDVRSDDVVITAGAQHAITVALASSVRPGEVVLAADLTYPGIRAAAQHLGFKLAGIKTDAQGIVPEAFAAACVRMRVRALYVVPSIQNPTTATLSAERREELARIAREHDVLIVEDDVHRLIDPDGPLPIHTLAPDSVFYIGSLSKVCVGGLRIAYMVPPRHAMQAVQQSILATCWMVPPLNAEIAARWIEDGTADRVVRAKREESQARLELAHQVLGSGFASQPGSSFVWLSLPEDRESAEFTEAARRRGVLITPMEVFDLGGPAKPQAVRVCLGCVEDRGSLVRGLEIVRDLLREGRTGAAMDIF